MCIMAPTTENYDFCEAGGPRMEDELEALKPPGSGPEMERWNREDLEFYIDAMKAEISKVEKILASKAGVTAEAAALFGSIKKD